MSQTRLDTRVVAAGLAPTRSKARDLVVRGFVRINGVVCDKPGQSCAENAAIELSGNAPHYVSRGSEKLLAALDHFGLSPAGRTALDVGASTGGFTEVLLSRGAVKVYAVDVGRDQLHPSLRGDPRVVSLEKTDARLLDATHVAEPMDVVVADVSFISLSKVLTPALALTSPHAFLVALVKPQFEAGPEGVGKDGVVREPSIRQAALDGVTGWLADQPGWRVLGSIPSPILGGAGNAEYLVAAERHG
jgi:23S rRNA (cytidine1920-2'-O)/16S rRNA (cytidine1409-2'-O)-methyltransferase